MPSRSRTTRFRRLPRERRERHLALDTKLAVVSRAAQTMLELSQTKRSLHVEYYIVALIVFEIALAAIQLMRG